MQEQQPNTDTNSVLGRLQLLYGVQSDSELSRVTGINRQTIGSWRARSSIPYELCVSLASERGVSLNWLLAGTGAMYLIKEALYLTDTEAADIGDHLKLAFQALGLNLKEVATLSGIPYSSLQNYVGGHREPNLRALEALGRHVGISLDWLITGQAGAQVASFVSDQKLLGLLADLNEDDRIEIIRLAENKQRIKRLEDQIQELKQQLDQTPTKYER